MNPELFGEMDLGRVSVAWDAVDESAAQIDNADRFAERPDTSLTARRFDEAQPAGKRTYITAGQLINSALGNQAALRRLITPGIDPYSPWTLIRTIFETTVWALWILEPEDGRERRTRGLKVEVLDNREYGKMMEAVPTTEEVRIRLQQRWVKAEVVYRQECEALGADWSKLNNKIIMTNELPKLATLKQLFGEGTWVAENIWRVTSGHIHGNSYATQLGSSPEHTVNIEGGQRRTVTINENQFTGYSKITAIMLKAAIDLYIDRSTRLVRSAR